MGDVWIIEQLSLEDGRSHYLHELEPLPLWVPQADHAMRFSSNVKARRALSTLGAPLAGERVRVTRLFEALR